MRIPSWHELANNRRLHILILILAVFVYYFGLWNAYFYSHDDFLWTGKMRHRDTLTAALSGLENGVRFLNFAMIWVKTQLFDLNASLYLLASLIQQIIVVFLVYKLIEIWTQKRFFAFFAALLFATKFSYWEILTSVSASDYSFWAIFYLAALLFFCMYIKWRRIGFYVVAVAAYAILAFGHDFALNLPLVLGAYYLTLGRGDRPIRSLGWGDLKLFIPILIIWGIHVSIQVGYVVGGTSEAVYSSETYGPGLHIISNLRFLDAHFLPNIPIYDRLAEISPGLVSIIEVISLVVAVVANLLAIYLFWKGSTLVRFALALIYLPFMQYTMWHGSFAGAPRYLYFSSIGFSILLALLLSRIYDYLRQHRLRASQLAFFALVAGIFLYNFAIIRVWIQADINNGYFRRAFVTDLNANFQEIEPEAQVYIEIPEYKYRDLSYVCGMIFEPAPNCEVVIDGDYTLDEVTSETSNAPVYWIRATDEGIEQIYPPVIASG